MENKIIEIKTEHFKSANSYTDPWGCPLYRAMKAAGYDVAYVAPNRVRMNDGSSLEIESYQNEIYAYAGLTFDEVSQMIAKAKNGQELETINVTLIPLE